jgi:signal transduction histidine kinase
MSADAEEAARRAARQTTLAAFAPPVQHEVNNLLTVVLANLDALKRVVPAGPPEKQLERIGVAARRIDEVVRGYLNLARRTVPDPVRLDAAEIIMKLEPVLRAQLGARLAVSLPETPQCPVRVDRAQADVGILDLIRDAALRLPRGARISLTARREDEVATISLQGLPADPAAAALGAAAASGGGRIDIAEEAGGAAVTLRLPIDTDD